MRTLAILPCMLLALLGCNEGPHLSVMARAKGDVLRVHVGSSEGSTLDIGGRSLTLGAGEHEAAVFIALEKFEPGRNELIVRAEKDGGTTEQTIAFMVPNGVGSPFLQMHRCIAGEGGVTTTVLGSFGKVKDCPSHADMRYQIVASTNPNATVSLGGDSFTADEDGNVTLDLEIAKNLLEVEVFDGWARVDDVRIPVPALISGEPPLTGTISVDVNGYSLVSELLEAFTPGQPFHPDLTGEGPGLAAYRVGDDHNTRFTGGPAPLHQLRVIALGERKTSKPAGSCGPYTDIDGGGGSFSAKRTDVDIEVTAYDARTGAEIGKKLFLGKEGSCPDGATMIDFKTPTLSVEPRFSTVANWLKELG